MRTLHIHYDDNGDADVQGFLHFTQAELQDIAVAVSTVAAGRPADYLPWAEQKTYLVLQSLLDTTQHEIHLGGVPWRRDQKPTLKLYNKNDFTWSYWLIEGKAQDAEGWLVKRHCVPEYFKEVIKPYETSTAQV